eukprot:763176-Hanusia_phi.AAC.4
MGAGRDGAGEQTEGGGNRTMEGARRKGEARKKRARGGRENGYRKHTPTPSIAFFFWESTGVIFQAENP